MKNIFKSGELVEDSVTEKNSATAADGKNYMTKFYNLDAIISVGYRVNSIRATQFRQWCTYVIRQFSLRGYIIDKKRMENGSFIGEDYFEHLLAEIREIRLSERRFYQKLTDIYATAVDYNKDAPLILINSILCHLMILRIDSPITPLYVKKLHISHHRRNPHSISIIKAGRYAPESDIYQPISQAQSGIYQRKLSPNSVPDQFTPTFNQRLFSINSETIGIAIHGDVNNHIPFLQRCPLAIDLYGFEMELVP